MDETIYEKFSSLSEISKVQLSKILKTAPGNKDLTLQYELIKPLERICGVSWLKNNSVDKIFKLDLPTSSPTTAYKTNIQFYMIYTNLHTFHKVFQQIQSQVDVTNPHKTKYHVICVPKSLCSFNELVEENGLWEIVQLHSFQWLPIHLDEGILSLELPLMFRDIYVNGDLTLLPTYAKSLWHLFLVFGRINFVLALGEKSQIIMKQLDMLETQTGQDNSDFGGLVIIDRNVDLPSALLTPGTYSALLGDIYGVQCGVCKYEKSPDSELPELDSQFNRLSDKQPVNLVLDSKKDSVYKAIKDKYFTQATDILRHLTKDLRVQGETSDLALHEMKRYVQTKLHSVAAKKKLVSVHLNAAETIVNFLHNKLEKLIEIEGNILQNRSKGKNLASLEEYLQNESDICASLALFILLNITQKLTDSEIKSFLSMVFVEFGYDCGFLYKNLIKGNILTPVSSKLRFPLLAKNNFFMNANKLKQITNEPEKVNFNAPNCCSYVFGGLYVPLVAQVASSILSGVPMDDLKGKLANVAEVSVSGQFQNTKRSLLVYVVGGITYSEIAALHLLETMMGVRIIKISDKIIGKSDITNAFISL